MGIWKHKKIFIKNDSGEIQESSEVVVDNDTSREISNSDIEYELDKRKTDIKKRFGTNVE